MKIGFLPYHKDSNKFIQITQEIIRECGCEIVPVNRRLLMQRKQNKADAVFLNWSENIYAENNIAFLFRILKRKIVILAYKLKSTKIVIYFHNHIPHDTPTKRQEMVLKYMKWLYKKADYIIILSKESKKYLFDFVERDVVERKTRYIPHPNYIDVYSKNDKKLRKDPEDKFRLLFIGQVRPYKNIELILELARNSKDKDICFTIMGKCSDRNYERELINLASELENIHLELKFVEDDQIDQIIREQDALVLPYDIKSSLNSGTVILAFSNARTVICPEIPTVDDFNKDNIYYYNYSSPKEHKTELQRRVLQAYNDWKTNPEKYYKKGLELFNEVQDKNSSSRIKDLYSELLKEIVE